MNIGAMLLVTYAMPIGIFAHILVHGRRATSPLPLLYKTAR